MSCNQQYVENYCNCANCTRGNQSVENYSESCCGHDPNDFDELKNTYTIDSGAYYAPPWPAQRTTFDQKLQSTWNIGQTPDFLNFNSGVPVAKSFLTKPSISKGQYYYYV